MKKIEQKGEKQPKEAEQQRPLSKSELARHEFSAGRGPQPSARDTLAWHEFSAGRGAPPK